MSAGNSMNQKPADVCRTRRTSVTRSAKGSSNSQKRIGVFSVALVALLVGLWTVSTSSQSVMPVPRQQFLTNNGDPCASCLLYSYAAGTNTPTATYADVTLQTPNANPIVLDSAGRATVFLDSRITYKFSLHTAADVPIWTVDSVDAVPSGLNVDVSGVAGEVLAQRQIVYLSSGLDVTIAGRWYLTDADLISKSSGASLVGVVISTAIGAGSSGTIRIQGRATGFAGLSEGLTYFVSATAGALTSTAPANVKVIGVAESASVLLLTPSAASSGGVGTFSSLQVSGTAANSIDTAGGIEAGSGNVQVVDATGKIPAISSTQFANLSGANLTALNATQLTTGTVADARLSANIPRENGNETITGLWDFDAPQVFSAAADRNIIIATNAGNKIAIRIRGNTVDNLANIDFTDSTETILFGSIGITPGGGLTYTTPSVGTLGHTFTGGPVNVPVAMRLTAVISPPQFTADVNNYNPAGLSTARIIRIDPSGGDGEHDITGIAAQAAGTVLTLTHVGASGKFTLKAVSGSSSAANRIAMVSDIGLSAPVGSGASVDRSSISIWYDGASSVWRTLD